MMFLDCVHEMKMVGMGAPIWLPHYRDLLHRPSGHPDLQAHRRGHRFHRGLCILSRVIGHEEQVEAVENSHHIISIPEPQSCRICEPDEDERDDVLVELGCGCKGEMSKMHRKCILQWYGPRMLLQNKYKCEICKKFLHMDTIFVVTEAVSDHENGGRAILMAALQKQLAPFVWMPDIESAADYDELVELLTATQAESFSTLQLHIPQEGTVDDEIVENFMSYRQLHCTWPLVFTFVAVAALVGGYAYLMEHYFSSTHR